MALDTSPEASAPTASWSLYLRVLVKAAALLVLCNLAFAALAPLDLLGRLSLYNSMLPGRERLPYGEQPQDSYNLNLYNLPAMMASHTITRPKAADEFRVILIGDSGTWGWFLENKDTLAGRINAGTVMAAGTRRVRAYNLGYPIMSLTKDLVLLDEAMHYQPDLIVWPVTLESFPRDKQLAHPLLQNNAGRVRALIGAYGLNLDAADPRFVDPNWLGRSIWGQRRALADLLRLQTYGFAWAATRVDQAIPAQIPRAKTDLDSDPTWHGLTQSVSLNSNNLALDVLAAGVRAARSVPVLIVNEPILISQGKNSDVRYNTFYPRWAYDEYRDLLGQAARASGWHYLDVWDQIPPAEFGDTPVHLMPQGSAQFAALVTDAILTTDGAK